MPHIKAGESVLFYDEYWPPVVTSVDISEGPEDGGTQIKITGQWFAAAQDGVTPDSITCKIGGVTAVVDSIDSDTQLTVTTGANTPGLKNIDVTAEYNTGGFTTGTGVDLFTYLAGDVNVGEYIDVFI